jgi:heme/flavin dehydrogenase (mycofactocin system)
VPVERLARRRLPPSVYLALMGGAETGATMDDNVASFGQVGLAPRTADMPGSRDLTTSVLGRRHPLPLLLSPAGAHAVHPEGELAIARAARSKGLAMGLSAFATRSIEEVVEENPQVHFQTYWTGSRAEIAARVERARAAGAVGLMLTTDWCFAEGRDWGSPRVPRTLGVRTAIRFAPEAVRRPRWLMRFAASGRLPDFTVPNLAVPGGAVPTMSEATDVWRATPPPSWDDIRWLAQLWDGPFTVKGVMRVDEAKRAVDAGATAVAVSNHGGNNLDGTPATLRVLPAIADAVGHEVDVLLDGGVRRGADIAKAVALGADAVMVGRAYLWGLAVGGQAGVERVVEILRKGLDSTLLALGRRSPGELCRADLHVPPDFVRLFETNEHA